MSFFFAFCKFLDLWLVCARSGVNSTRVLRVPSHGSLQTPCDSTTRVLWKTHRPSPQCMTLKCWMLLNKIASQHFDGPFLSMYTAPGQEGAIGYALGAHSQAIPGQIIHCFPASQLRQVLWTHLPRLAAGRPRARDRRLQSRRSWFSSVAGSVLLAAAYWFAFSRKRNA